MRLATGMGRKSALAGTYIVVVVAVVDVVAVVVVVNSLWSGLWWGGGKGSIAQDPNADVTNPQYRENLMGDYGRYTTLMMC